MTLGYNMLGQQVDLDAHYLASGYYLYAVNPDDSACPEGMRQGLMHIRGAGDVDTCSGKIFQENMPDIYLVDYRYKTIVRLIMLATIISLVVLIIRKK